VTGSRHRIAIVPGDGIGREVVFVPSLHLEVVVADEVMR
jgi:isocitrate/isopropylmalate dehydrogenase